MRVPGVSRRARSTSNPGCGAVATPPPGLVLVIGTTGLPATMPSSLLLIPCVVTVRPSSGFVIHKGGQARSRLAVVTKERVTDGG